MNLVLKEIESNCILMENSTGTTRGISICTNKNIYILQILKNQILYWESMI